jgi:tetratricopeptide (TPR) repeat protein
MSSGAHRSPAPRALSLPLLAALLVVVAATAWTTIADPDVPFHLAAGRAVVDAGRVPQTNIFGYTLPDARWGSHQWLGSVLFYAVYLAGGFTGLGVFKVLLVAALFAFLYVACSRSEWPGGRAIGAGRWDAAVLVFIFLVAAWAARPRFVDRPLLFSALLEAALLAFLARYEKRSTRSLLLLVPVFVVWWNLHAGYIYGLLILGAFVAGDLLERSRRAAALRLLRASALAVAVAIPLAWLANPGSLRGLLFPVEMFRSSLFSGVIDEFRRTTIGTNPAFTAFMLLALVAVIASWARAGRPRTAHLFLLAGFGFLAVSRVRMILDMSLVGAPIVAGLLASALPNRGPRRLPVALAVLFLAAVPVLIARSEVPRFGHGLDPLTNPEGAYQFLQEHDLPGEVMTSDMWSGSFLWRFYPQRKVYIHNQLEVYGEPFWREEYLPLLAARSGWEKSLERYGVNTLVLRYSGARYRQRIADAAFASRDWSLVYWDDLAEIMVRNRAVPEGFLEKYAFRVVNPENPELAGLVAAGYGAQAERELRRALEVRPECRRAWSFLGELLLQTGRLDEAEQAFDRMRELALHSGERAVALTGLGRVQEQRGDWQGALALYDRARDQNRRDPFLRMRRAAALVAVGRIEDARKEAEELVRDERATAGDLVYVGTSFADHGEKTAAAWLFGEAERRVAGGSASGALGEAATLLAIGVAWDRAGEAQLAIDAYRRAHDARPDWGDPVNNWAWLLIQDGRAGEALPLARQAVSLDPQDGYFWGTLGQAFLETGQVDSARVALETAAARVAGEGNEAEATTLVGLARAYHQLGMEKESRRALARADSIGLTDALRDEVGRSGLSGEGGMQSQ